MIPRCLLQEGAVWILKNQESSINIPVHVAIQSFYQDSSIEWIFVEFYISIPPKSASTYVLTLEEAPSDISHANQSPIYQESIHQSEYAIQNHAGQNFFNVPTSSSEDLFTVQTFSENNGEVNSFSAQLEFLDSNSISHSIVLKHIDATEMDELGRITYSFKNEKIVSYIENLGALNVDVEITHHQSQHLLDLEIKLHNPLAAEHKQGLWDLGDPASIKFEELKLVVTAIEPIKFTVEYSADNKHHRVECVSVEQLSSGGRNVNSSVHQDCEGKIWSLPVGYSVTTSESKFTGSRINPLGIVEIPACKMAVSVNNFWQEFPSKLELCGNSLDVSIFANPAGGKHELQPGECKRKYVSLKISGNEDSPAWMISRIEPALVSGDYSSRSTVYERSIYELSDFDQQLRKLILEPEKIIGKRELIDEYGWRNFGEVFADHESLYTKAGEALLVSHYNNQYDLILGFGLQYIRTGDTKWFNLHNELAKHNVDIDQYHTDQDRIEYNHGLFWHTNHYEDAGTATHRTYSQLNFNPNSSVGSSGGPGPEHCYTTGLLLHYRLTNDHSSANAVLSLANWVHNYFEGDPSISGQLNATRHREIARIKALLKRQTVQLYDYPARRSTGNLLTAYLDAYEVNGNRSWLSRAENVIENSFSSDDDLVLRGIGDVESGWSYTIFLQSVARYMGLKEQLDELDISYWHARESFVHYCFWMLNNEKPYLENPQDLEFANDTWAAQDIRKYVIFVYASFYDPAREEQYLNRAEYFSNHIIDALRRSDTLHFTRLQAIIMWNIGLCSNVGVKPECVRFLENTNKEEQLKRNTSVAGECESIVRKLLKAFKQFDFKLELKWWKNRR